MILLLFKFKFSLNMRFIDVHNSSNKCFDVKNWFGAHLHEALMIGCPMNKLILDPRVNKVHQLE